jgi:hypothetical protein
MVGGICPGQASQWCAAALSVDRVQARPALDAPRTWRGPAWACSTDTLAPQSELKGVPMSLIAILIIVAIIALAVFIVRRVA